MKLKDMFDLHNKVAIVTGAHLWLGYDMACALAEFGCSIVITSRDLERAQAACQKISEEYGVDTLALVMDQCHINQVEKMAKDAFSWKGHIDILINNAGGGSGQSTGNLFERSIDDIINLINTNLLGTLFCCREVGKYMIQQKSGKIINSGSIAGIVGRDRRMYHISDKMEQPVDYAASKAGIIGLSRDLAGFMAPYGINVNCISPGGFDKGDLPEKFVEEYSDATMSGRMGKMGTDIKGAALFLSSSASDYVNGHNLVVDGGFSCWK